jgi:hypothetical protein
MLVDFKIIANDSIINCETDVKCQIDEFNKFKSSELYFSGHSPAEIEYMRLTQPEIFKHNEESLKDMEANIRYISDIVLNILSYLNLPSTIENTKVKENAIIKHKKNKNGKKKKGTNKSYIYKKQYIIERHDIDKVITLDGDYIKKVYQRRVSEWGVRGHWRTYADGKKVWIKSHTKKSKTPVLEPTINKNKEYKITRVDL